MIHDGERRNSGKGLSEAAKRFVGVTVLSGLILSAAAQSQAIQTWELKESVGYDWKKELVFFALKAEENLSLAQLELTDEAGNALPCQLWLENGLTYVALMADLPPYATRQYSLVRKEDARKPPVDLSVRESDESIEILAGRTGVRLGRAKQFKPGTPFSNMPPPVLTVRGVSGAWLGEGYLKGEHPVSNYSFRLEAKGPLFAQAKVRFEFGERKFYQVRVRLIAGEDVVLIEEDFALSREELASVSFVKPPDLAPPIGTPSNYSDWLVNKGIGWNDIPTDVERFPRFCFNFTKGLQADRARGVGIGQRKKAYAQADLKHAANDWRLGFVLTPFQERGYRQNAIGFDRADGKDYLGVFYRFMSRWVHPNENRVLMPWLEEGVVGQFLAYEGHREWGLMVTEPGEHTNDILAKRQGRKFGAIRRPHV
ncbi:MAG: hypothetical protein QF473_37395, partial [Planctomycetota bacterium]|nr:hypothetical protein [Planctomycetota bacterium]